MDESGANVIMDRDIQSSVAESRGGCEASPKSGWELAVASDVRELAPPTAEEVAALRRWDPRGWFLRER